MNVMNIEEKRRNTGFVCWGVVGLKHATGRNYTIGCRKSLAKRQLVRPHIIFATPTAAPPMIHYDLSHTPHPLNSDDEVI
jgi:hypothetical protein